MNIGAPKWGTARGHRPKGHPPTPSHPFCTHSLCHVCPPAVEARGPGIWRGAHKCESGKVPLCPHLCGGHTHSQWGGHMPANVWGKSNLLLQSTKWGGLWPGGTLGCCTAQPAHFACPLCANEATQALQTGFRSVCWPPHQWHAAVSLLLGPAGGAMGCAAPPGCLGGQS